MPNDDGVDDDDDDAECVVVCESKQFYSPKNIKNMMIKTNWKNFESNFIRFFPRLCQNNTCDPFLRCCACVECMRAARKNLNNKKISHDA